MTFAEKIFKLRKQAGLSQEELAEKLNVSRQAVSRWEMGIAIPDAANLLQLSKLFGVTVDYLINDELLSDEDIPIVKSKQADVRRESKKLPTVLNAVWMGAAITVLLSIFLFAFTDSLPVMIVPILTLPFPAFYFLAFHRNLSSLKPILFSSALLLPAINVITIVGYLISIHFHYDESSAKFILWGFFAGHQWVNVVCFLNAAALTSFGGYIAFASMAKKWWASLLIYAGTSTLSGVVVFLYLSLANSIPYTLAIPIIILAISILLCLLGCMAYMLQEKSQKNGEAHEKV